MAIPRWRPLSTGYGKRQRTVIVMAHRPSAIAAVDMLLVLRAGHQCAFGPKDQVLRQVTQVATGDPEPMEGQQLAG